MAMAAALAGAAVGGVMSIGGSLGTAGLQAWSGNQLQTSAQNYNTSIMNRAESSFTEAGLPRFMAYQSSNDSMPSMKFSMGGANFWSGGPVNSNLPLIHSPAQSYFHSGTPDTKNRYNAVGPREIGDDNEMTVFRSNQAINAGGQNDRIGLGMNRYSMNNTYTAKPIMPFQSFVRPQDTDRTFVKTLN